MTDLQKMSVGDLLNSTPLYLEGTPHGWVPEENAKELARRNKLLDNELTESRAECERLKSEAREALGFAYAYCATWESQGKRVGDLEFPKIAAAWDKTVDQAIRELKE